MRSLLALLALTGCAASGGTLGGPDEPGPGATPTPPRVLVNELMADNATTILDEAGRASDWLELFNPGEQPVSLEGWTLSDDWTRPDLHPLPKLDIEAGGFLLLWASGDPDAGDRHLPFGLARDGEAVGLHDPDGRTADWVQYPALPEDHAWARRADGSGLWHEVARGSPGASNSGR